MTNPQNQAVASTWVEAPTLQVATGGDILVYRDLGMPGGTPVVLLAHLGATLDEWDPRIIDHLAEHHRVVAVDLPGVGASTGRVAATVADMAAAAIGFIDTMGFAEVDILGFSLGGFIAQQIAVDRPDLVRRLILAGTGPAGGDGIDRATGPAYVYWDIIRGLLARTDAKEFLFFHRDASGKTAAKAYLERLNERIMDRDQPITVRAFQAQLAAIQAWGQRPPQDLSVITAPTLIANGDHDRMVPSVLSEDLHRRIAGSTLTIYPNSGHGGVFQYHQQFSDLVVEHLAAP